MHRRGIVPLPAVREANECCFSGEPVELLLVPCRFLPKLTRNGKRGSRGCSFACDAVAVPTELRHTMKLSDLTDTERKVWQAAVTGTLVDLRVGDSDIDSPERYTEWGTERTVRAEVIVDLLLGDGEAAAVTVRGVRLQGARITGDLNLEATTLRCPLALLDCSFACAIDLTEATAVSVCLSGSHVPAVRARQLLTRGDLRLDKGFSVLGGVGLASAHIGGQLSCMGGQFSNSDGPALGADGLIVDGGMFCGEGFSASGEVRLAGAHIGGTLDCEGGQFSNSDGPALSADGLIVDGSMFCGEGFSTSGEVRLAGAHITGQLNFRGGQFSNPDGRALNAGGLTVDLDMFCDGDFAASGEVRLAGAHIAGVLDCRGGQFSNPNGFALNADVLTVDLYMFCGEGFSATGEVRLAGAHIAGVLDCADGLFSNPNGSALNADGLIVDGDMSCTNFVATGKVRLAGTHIGGEFDCTGGQISDPRGEAIIANGLVVDGDMICDGSFVGVVYLVGAHIGGRLVCAGGHFSNPGGFALYLERATVSGPLFMQSAVVQGILDLTAAKVGSYHDDQASWPEKLRLDGFVYDAIDGASAKERLEKSEWQRRNKSGYSPQIYERLEKNGWLHRNEKGYSPQIYDQLAAVYRRAGHDDDARRVLIEKQRRRFAQRNLLWRLGGYVLDGLVGYGYRNWLALVWVAGLLVLGTVLFGYVYPGDLTATNKATAPPFQPFLYTLDLLLPVASLHQRDGWVAHGAAQWWSVFFIIMGWILATAVVLSLTGFLKRD
jgi:hypothetical protein